MKDLNQFFSTLYGHVAMNIHGDDKQGDEAQPYSHERNLILRALHPDKGPDSVVPHDPTGNAKLDQMFRKLGVRIVYGHDTPGVVAGSSDPEEVNLMHMPYKAAFHTEHDYRHVMGHELCHWARGNMDGPVEEGFLPRGGPRGGFIDVTPEQVANYIEEEVAAELTNALLMPVIDPDNAEQHFKFSSHYLSHMVWHPANAKGVRFAGVTDMPMDKVPKVDTLVKMLPEAIRRYNHLMEAIGEPAAKAA